MDKLLDAWSPEISFQLDDERRDVWTVQRSREHVQSHDVPSPRVPQLSQSGLPRCRPGLDEYSQCGDSHCSSSQHSLPVPVQMLQVIHGKPNHSLNLPINSRLYQLRYIINKFKWKTVWLNISYSNKYSQKYRYLLSLMDALFISPMYWHAKVY